MVLTRFGGQPPTGCESNLGATGTGANEKRSHLPLISAIVKVNSPPTLAIGALEMILVEEREAIRRAYYPGSARVRGRSPANTTILARPWIKRSTISRRSPTGSAARNRPQCSGPFGHVPTSCWPKMCICRRSSSTRVTKSTNCSRPRAIRAVRRGYACT